MLNFSPFLLYHKIDRPPPDARIRGAYTSPRRFEGQISYLLKRGVKFTTAAELADRFLSEGRYPPRTAAITFDDGWKDNFTNAFPILKRLGVTATVFVVPRVLGLITDSVTADGEGPREHMSPSEVRQMAKAGIEIGSHSLSHQIVDRIPEDGVRSEVFDSKAEIEAIIQQPCRTFAYPAGFYSDFARAQVEEAGYTAAFTTVYGPESGIDRYAINRVEVLRRDRYPFAFSRKMRPLTHA